MTATCPGNAPSCPTALVKTWREWAWHDERVRCHRCGQHNRWAVWITELQAHLCPSCQADRYGGRPPRRGELGTP